MLDVVNLQASGDGRISRRDFVRVGAMAAGGLSLAPWLSMRAHAQTTQAQARSVIQLWMGGGPCHIDTFDPKPSAGPEITGPYRKPINTNVKGIQIGQMLPMLAKCADKFTILRGMTHGNSGHETATYVMQTGTAPAADLVYPAVGAVVALKLVQSGAYQGALPPYMSVTSPIGRFSESGFLGSAYKVFATGGNPNSDKAGGGALGDEADPAKTQKRRELVESFDSLAQRVQGDPKLKEMVGYQEKAYELILGDAKQAFEVNRENAKTRERYGRTTFGQQCLLARRLVEKGVPFVTVNLGGWDTHRSHFEAMGRKLPELDQGFSALLEDLAQRGLLETTIVTWFGEFGRTPKIANEPPWYGGRHHFGNAFSAVVAGGGFKGGQIIGATDAKGEKTVERPVYPWDLSGSIYQLLGIDPHGHLPHPHGCVAYVTPAAGAVASGGLLKEIM